MINDHHKFSTKNTPHIVVLLLTHITKWYVSNALKLEVSISLRDSTTSLLVLRDLWPTTPVLLTTCLPFVTRSDKTSLLARQNFTCLKFHNVVCNASIQMKFCSLVNKSLAIMMKLTESL